MAKRKAMRRANGTGAVYKLSGNRRRPWAVRITVDYNQETGSARYKYLGYYATKKEAEEALGAYLYTPEHRREMTFEEAWKGWKEDFTGTKSTVQAYNSGYNRCRSIWKRPLKDITLEAMQECADQEPHTFSTAKGVQKVLSALLEYGYTHDACPASRKELVQYIRLPEKKVVKERTAFTEDEIYSIVQADRLLPIILICTGMRRGEFMSLKPDDIDLENQVIHVRKSKTSNGIRDIPIADHLVPYVKKWKDDPADFGRSNHIFRKQWDCPEVGDKTPHEARHTFVTLLASAGVDDRIVKQLCGHSAGITTDVYTHFDLAAKLEVVNSIFNRFLPAPVASTENEYSHILQA